MRRLCTQKSSAAPTNTNTTNVARAWLLAAATLRFCRAHGLSPNISLRLLALAPPPPNLPPSLAYQLDALADAPELAPFWSQAETVGWLAQHADEARQSATTRRLNAGRKADHAALITATQVYTPAWIARILAENTLGRLWLAIHPDSRLAAHFPALVPLPDAPPHTPKLAREIRVLDPSCGAMHLGCAAFDVLAAMYHEELERAGESGWPRMPSVRSEGEIAASILTHNLVGIDLSDEALRLATLSLTLKAHTLPHTTSDTLDILPTPALASAAGLPLGSLTPATMLPPDTPPLLASLLAERFDVVLTNPPYLDIRAYPPDLRAALRANYPAASRNLYAAFLLRGAEWLTEGGRLGIITPQTFMFLASFRGTRATLRERTAVETLTLLGYGAFAGAVVDCAACVLRREASAERRMHQRGVYVKVDAPPTAEAKQLVWERAVAALRAGISPPEISLTQPTPFDALPGSPWVFWHTEERSKSTDTAAPTPARTTGTLDTLAQVVVGLQTGDNARFLRYWWEVGRERVAWDCPDGAAAQASGVRWFPHAKGGDFRRWWGNREHVVNWAADGAEVRSLGRESGRIASRAQNVATYFRAGITWTHTSRKGLSVRILPPGTICNVEAVAAFPRPTLDTSPEDTSYLLLALLNTPAAERRIARLNPTVHFGTREVAALPLPTMPESDRAALITLAKRAVTLAREEAAEDESDPDFRAPPPWPPQPPTRALELHRIEAELAARVSALYGGESAEADFVAGGPLGAVSTASAHHRLSHDRTELARRWLSYAVGLAFGRYSHKAVAPDLLLPDALAPLDMAHPDNLPQRVTRILTTLLGDDAAIEVTTAATTGQPLAAWLGSPFFRWHLARYRRRPLYWLLESPRRAYAAYLYYPQASAATLPLLRGERYLGRTLASAHGRAAADLRAFATSLDEVIAQRDERGEVVGWAPEPDDGVLLNAAPLAALLPTWRAARPGELERCWEALSTGALDWSRTARRYWPNRVAAACRRNTSYALAHALPPLPL